MRCAQWIWIFKLIESKLYMLDAASAHVWYNLDQIQRERITTVQATGRDAYACRVYFCGFVAFPVCFYRIICSAALIWKVIRSIHFSSVFLLVVFLSTPQKKHPKPHLEKKKNDEIGNWSSHARTHAHELEHWNGMRVRVLLIEMEKFLFTRDWDENVIDAIGPWSFDASISKQ